MTDRGTKMTTRLSRRRMMASAGFCLGAAATSNTIAAEAETRGKREPFGYCLNMATIRGQKLPLAEEIEIAAKAGYEGVEPWVSGIRRFAEQGGSLAELKKRIAELGLSVEGAIGFADWISDDDAKRAGGLEQMKRDMDLVGRVGGRRIAAAPGGAYRTSNMDLLKVAGRYRAVLELGRQMGVVPQLEIWGSSKTLSRLGEAAFVVVEAAHPDACLLLDAYHIYKGGSDFSGLLMLNGAKMHVFHINDYPADPPRQTISDADRVYPGDGVAPLTSILRDLAASGFSGMLSLEVFNRQYWKQDPLEVARLGLKKMKAVVRKTFG